MKKFGVFIIKPDAMNKHDLFIIQHILAEHGFDNPICFVVKNYVEVMKKYRESDIKFKNLENAEAELKGCNVALSAYEKLFKNANGALILIPLKNQSFKEFYDEANVAKKEIRQKIENDRGYYYAYVNYLTSPTLTKLSHSEYKLIKERDKANINRAYVNGIHLEDYECLESNFCLNFMVKNGIINKTNIINLENYASGLEICKNL